MINAPSTPSSAAVGRPDAARVLKDLFNFAASQAPKDTAEEEERLRRFKFLLEQTELFSHFVESGKDARDFKRKGSHTGHGSQTLTSSQHGDVRHRRSEKEEDEELIENAQQEREHVIFTESPSCSFLLWLNSRLCDVSIFGQTLPEEPCVTTKSVGSTG